MNRRFLDDEQLDRKEQFKVLKEIFAVDLRKILLIRIRKALNKKMPRKGVLEKIAAISSRTHGDARKAVELLSKSAQIAEREGTAVTMDVVDVAMEEIERDKYVAMIKSAPKQLQASLYAIIAFTVNSKNPCRSGSVIRRIVHFMRR